MTETKREPLTALDSIAVALTIIVAVGMVTLAPKGAMFRAMYADFGSTELPLLTRWMTSWEGPIVAIVPAAIALVMGLRARALSARRAYIVIAFLLGLAAIGVWYVGAYGPIWQLAGRIRAE